MTEKPHFEVLNEGKSDFSTIYNEPDPRSYFRVLGGLDYILPDLAAPIFKQLIAARAKQHPGRPVTVLDLGCSYGINAALLRLPLKLEMLRRRYMLPEIQALTSGAIKLLDTSYFAAWPARPNLPNLKVIGLDMAANSVRYAEQVGIVHAGLAEDLEMNEISDRARLTLADVDIVLSTGCVGYVTERTFGRILSANCGREMPWIASFVLRMFPYDTVASKLDSFGLSTERFDGATFVQRRFRDAAEYETTLSKLEELGIDPTGREAEGLFHAELFVSRPNHLIRARPLRRLVSVISGQHKPFGGRYVHVPGQGHRSLLLN